MNVRIIRVLADDWEGIYVNGILEEQGHSVAFGRLMQIIEHRTVTHWVTLEVDPDWIEDEAGELPPRLEDCNLLNPLPEWAFT